MAYDLQTQFDSKNFTPAAQVPAVFGMPRNITGITIHHWGALGQLFETVRQWLCTNNVPTSAHYIAQAGLVACIVAPENAAWHAGTARGNATTIGIECRPEATDEDYATIAELVRDLRAVYGDLPLYGHNNWIPTNCPGRYDLARIDRLARAGEQTTPPPAVTPLPVTPPAPTGNLQWVVDPGDTLSAIAAFYNGPSVAQIAAANGITDPDALNVGDVLTIPGLIQWVVDPGDTLSAIAAYYNGPSIAQIAATNGITDPDTLSVGDVLTIQKG